MAHLPSSIPGAWISSTELDNPSPFTSSPPGPALLSGFLSKSNGSPSSALPALSKSSMNHLDRVVQFHRRLSTALFPQESPKSVRKGSRLLKTYKSSVIGTPQSIPPSLVEEGSSAATTPYPSPLELPPSLPPLHFPSSPLPDNETYSISSRVTRLSFSSVPSFSPDFQFDSASTSDSVLDPGWNFSSPVYQHAQLACSYSSDSSIIDAFPSSASIRPIPSIPSIASHFELNNLPTPSPSTLLFEPNSPYAHYSSGEIPNSSIYETIPAISTTPSAISLVDPFGSVGGMLTMSNPPASRRRARIVVREDVTIANEEAGSSQRRRKDTWTYACDTLPYEAGFRPHLYVDNSERSLERKGTCKREQADLIVVESPVQGDNDGVCVEKVTRSSSKMMKKLAGVKTSRFWGIKSRKIRSGRKTIGSSCLSVDGLPSPFLGSDQETTRPSHSMPSTPGPTFKAPAKKRFSVRPLSLFLLPKPRVDFVEGHPYEDLSILDESFEPIGPHVEEAENGSSQLPSFFPAKKDMDVKNRRRKSWFNLASSSSGLDRLR